VTGGAPAANGFAFAGGQSRRMGRDKALVEWDGAALLDRTLDRLRACCRSVCILSGPSPRYEDRGVRVVLDEAPDIGPLAGVAAGLAVLDQDVGLFLAVDLPAVPVALLVRLIGLSADADAVVPVSGRGPEPLCAVYGPACLEPVRRRIAAGERKMTCFWPDVRVREVSDSEIAAFGDPDALFRNINTPQDLTRS
jgi:molybdopterin-guanine dinucleotide biosynthesis protein A